MRDSMVTIIPLDVDDDLVREGLSYAIGSRVLSAIRRIEEQAKELVAGGLVDRGGWHRLFANLAELHATSEPILEYAKAFEDQWPADPDGAPDEASA